MQTLTHIRLNFQSLVDSLLSCYFDISIYESLILPESLSDEDNIKHIEGVEKYKAKNIPDNFMRSETAKAEIQKFIETVELIRETQDDMNKLYADFCQTVTGEMERQLKQISQPNNLKKRFKRRKPYWETLTESFKQIILIERTVIKHTYRANKHTLRYVYKNS